MAFHRASAGVRDDNGTNRAWGPREVWLRFTFGELTRDTVVPGRFEDDALRATVRLRPDERSHPLQLEAEVRLPNGVGLFAGEGEVQYAGLVPVARVQLRPRPVLAFLAESRIGLATLDGSMHAEHELGGQIEAIDVSPSDGSLVYQTRPAGGSQWSIATLDPYTGVGRRLVEGGGGPSGQYSPRFSPDGRWIYFLGLLTAPYNWEIWRVRADGSNAEPLLGLFLTNSAFAPAPSHDGTRMAYRSDSATNGELRIMDLATRATRSTGVFDATSARWSPDDQLIAYRVIGFLPEGGRLRVMRLDGTGDRALAPDLAIGPGFDWLDDGSSIVAATETPFYDIPRPQHYHAVRIDVLTGAVDTLSSLGPVHSIAAAP